MKAPTTRTEFADFVRAERYGVVATSAADGAPEAAYVAFAATSDTIVFNARSDSRKVANLLANPRVALVIGGAAGVSTQCDGVAVVTTGDDRDKAARLYASQLPEFAKSSDDPRVAYVRITFGDVKVCDARGERTAYSTITR